MKNFSLLLLLFPATSFSQIPNAGFENWTSGNPDSWLTLNAPPFAIFVTQSANAHSGSSAIKLDVIDFVGTPTPATANTFDASNNTGYFPVPFHPQQFSGWYIFNSVGSDNALITLTCKDENGEWGGAVFLEPTTSLTYQPFTVSVIDTGSTGTSDSVFVLMTMSDTVNGTYDVGTYLIVDDLSLSGPAGIEEGRSSDIQMMSYPNPAQSEIYIAFMPEFPGDATLSIFDYSGKLIETRNIEVSDLKWKTFTMNTDKMSSGLYSAVVTTSQGTGTKQFVVSK